MEALLRAVPVRCSVPQRDAPNSSFVRAGGDSSKDPLATAPGRAAGSSVVWDRGAAEPIGVLSKPVGNAVLRLCKQLVIEERFV